MGRIRIDRERCKGCELCVHFCPKGCIVIDESYNSRGYRPAVPRNGFSGASSAEEATPDCTGCAICARICPDIAIEVWR